MQNFDERITKYFFDLGRSNEALWRFISLRGMYVFVLTYLFILFFSSSATFIKLTPVIALALTFLITMLIRYTVRRKRPKFEGSTYRAWLNSFSFPSLHASLSFAFSVSLSVILWNVSPDMWGIVCIVFLNALAGLIALSRLAVGVHYISDIIVGLLIGIAVSAMV